MTPKQYASAIITCILLPLSIWAADPYWLNKSIIPREDFVFAVGCSGIQPGEQAARDEAVKNASKEFIRYCKMEVDSFDSSVETYSGKEGKSREGTQVNTHSTVRSHASISGAIPEEWQVLKKPGGFIASVLLKIPKSEFDRISKENPPKLTMDIQFYYEDAHGKIQMLNDGCILKSGDGYALYVKPGSKCYLYLYHVDQNGTAYRLFPNKKWKTGGNPLPADKDCWLPNSRGQYILHEVTGKDCFFAFGSPDKIREFESDDALELSKQKLDFIVRRKKMELALVKEGKMKRLVIPPKGKKANEAINIKKKLISDNAFFYETWYWHSYKK